MSKHSEKQIDALTDEQMMFNTVYTHLIKQGGPSIKRRTPEECAASIANTSPVACVYRADDGKMCAVGFLIPDAVYSSHFEGMGVGTLLREGCPEGLGHLKPHASLLAQMQNAHDDFVLEGGRNWAKYITRKFREIARNYDFDTSVLAG